jgi:hypothetical protein
MSDPFEFKTEFRVTSIDIIEETKLNFDLVNNQSKAEIKKVYLRKGDFIPKVNII